MDYTVTHYPSLTHAAACLFGFALVSGLGIAYWGEFPCTNLRELTEEVFGRRFAPNGGSPHEHRHEETADDHDKRATRVRTRTPDPPTRVRTLRGTRPEARSRARRLAQ